MADRYWVGGTGTWNGTNTANWSATTGGAGGASAPTASDNVYFNANSGGGVVTINSTGAPSCANLSFAGFTGTYVGSSYRFTCTGSFDSGSTARFLDFRASFTANSPLVSTPYLIFTGVPASNWSELFIDPATGKTFNLYTDITSVQDIRFYGRSGSTINTNNYNITGSNFYFFGGSGYGGTLNTGSSTFTCTAVTLNSGSAHTYNFSANTITSTSALGLTLNGLTFAGAVTVTGSSGINVISAGTVGSLSYTLTGGTSALTFYANFTITGLLQLTNSGGGALNVTSDTFGTQRTVSAGSVSLSAAAFRDIYASGAAIPWTGTGLIDNGNNTNILFPAPVTANSLFFGSNF